MDALFNIIGVIVYASLAVIALWGGFCAILAWRRIAQIRFRDELEQDEFLDELDQQLLEGQFESAVELCEDDRRAMPQLALYAIEMRDIEYPKLCRRLSERFRQDVLADLDHHLSWVSTVIKSAPMIGLFGTVLGMMGAFGKLSSGSKVDTALMAENIMLALITTACGLAIAVPLVILSAGIQSRLRKTENLMTLGMSRLLDTIKTVKQSVR